MENNSGLKEVFDIVNRIFKLDCRAYNESYMSRRINSRIMANNLAPDDFRSYAKILVSNSEEQRRLYDSLTINVTQFFRDIKLWEVVKKDILPKIIEEKRNKSEKSLQIWSCGCSSGEEPYSLAILLREALGGRKDIFPVVTATDIDQFSLEKAQNAVYDMSAFKSMPQEYLSRYFKPVLVKNLEKYELDPSAKALVQFKRNNFLVDPPPVKNADVVFCRNVIIYFTPAAKDKLMSAFYETLSENGWLVLGKSEVLFTIKMQQRFYLYNVEERIYKKERRKIQVPVNAERRKNWWLGYNKEKTK